MDDLMTIYVDFCHSICIMGYHGNGSFREKKTVYIICKEFEDKTINRVYTASVTSEKLFFFKNRYGRKTNLMNIHDTI